MNKKHVLILCFLLITVMGAVASTAEPMPWEPGLEKLLNSLTGPTAMILGGLMFFGCGAIALFSEGAAIKKGMWVVAGVGVMLQAPTLVTKLVGTSAGHLLPENAVILEIEDNAGILEIKDNAVILEIKDTDLL